MPDDDETTGGTTPAGERERHMLERSMVVYSAHLRSVVRDQRAVIEFRQAQRSHEALHTMLVELARNRQAAAEGRNAIRSAVRGYVLALRADNRAPEIALGMMKRAVSAIVVAMPMGEALPNPQPLLDDTVRWAIQAYYEAA